MLKSGQNLVRAASLRSAPVSRLVTVGVVALLIGAAGHYASFLKTSGNSVSTTSLIVSGLGEDNALRTTLEAASQSAAAQTLVKAREAVVDSVKPASQYTTDEVELESGQTFAELLSESGVAYADAQAAMNALSKVYDLRKLKAGQDFSLTTLSSETNSNLTEVSFTPEATKTISITRDGTVGFKAVAKAIPIERKRIAAHAEINSSLFEAGKKAGIPHSVMASFLRIYSHEVDFQRDIHPGDNFEVMFDQPTTAQGKAVGEGSIVYASINTGGKTKSIYRVTFSDGTVDYFNEKGQSARRTLLRTPVAVAHITSGFGMRTHPLLGYSKMHKGIDFGAPIGTPIYSAGAGVIDEVGFKNGYGRYIRVRHNGQYSTAYAHMSRFAQNIYRGARVNQGDVIGYVGMSGRATGPHLHYEVLINGQQANPMSVNMPTGRTLDGKLMASFKEGQQRVKAEFGTLVNKKPDVGFVQASTPASSFKKTTDLACGKGGC